MDLFATIRRESVGEDYQEKVLTIIMGTSHHFPQDISAESFIEMMDVLIFLR